MDLEGLNRILEANYGGKRWILVAEAVAATTRLVAQLQEWDVTEILIIAASTGAGDLPGGVEVHLTQSSGSTIMGGVRAFSESLDSPDVRAAVDTFDVDGSAWVMAPPFGLDDELAGRRLYGGRLPEWRALEDKTVIDVVWDRAGVRRASSEVVPIEAAGAAHDRLASRSGSVWVADNSTGWHGGGEYTRWVASDDAVEEAIGWFGGRAHRVRVMPFLDGIPCSIHGFVTRSGLAAFRPVEMLIARVPGSSGFFYLGFATTWDPPEWVRSEMRTAALSVASHLAEEVGYLGPFSIDGVATVEGFRPTELNPRLSAGLGIQAGTVESLPLGLATRAMIESDVELDARWLEETVVASADANRVAGCAVIAPETTEPSDVAVRVDGRKVVVAGAGVADGKLETGPASAGSYTRLTLESESVPRGASMAPYAVSAAVLAARTWNLTVPDLEPAPDVLG